jgi:hypothetical protein
MTPTFITSRRLLAHSQPLSYLLSDIIDAPSRRGGLVFEILISEHDLLLAGAIKGNSLSTLIIERLNEK